MNLIKKALRIALIVFQAAGLISNIVAFTSFASRTSQGLAINISYLIIFLIGFWISVAVFVFGLLNKLFPKIAIFASDILLAIAAIIISSIAVDFHIKLNILNFGTDAYAAAAAFGFISAAAYLADAIYYFFFDKEYQA